MFKIKISEISDGLFVIIASFLLSFVFAFYFFKDNVSSIIVSLPFSGAVFCAYLLCHKKKKGRLAIKREDEERYVKCLNALCLMSREEGENVVFKALDRLGKNPLKVIGGLVSGDNFYYVNFSYDSVSAGGIVKAYKQTPKGKNLVFVGVSFSEDGVNFAKGFEKRITLVPLTDLFPLLKQTDCLPDGGFIPKKQKIGAIKLLRATFNPKRSKTFALYGIFLLAMSRFVFFPVWYIVSGSIFLIYALAIKFFAPKSTDSTFL